MRFRPILIGLLVVVFSLAASGTLLSQDVMDITGPPTNSWHDGTKVITGEPIAWTIHFGLTSNKMTGMTNGFRIFLSDVPTGLDILDPGPGFAPMACSVLVDMQFIGFDGGFFVDSFGIDGYGADTIGFGAFDLYDGIPSGTEEDVYELSTVIDPALGAAGLFLCLDSTFYPPGGAWLWSVQSGLVVPYWGGPYCYEINECCIGNRGNVDMEIGPAGPVDVIDLTMLVDFLFQGLTDLPCPTVGNVDGLDGPAGPVDISDLTFMMQYLWHGGPAPPDCM